jgi:ElaB/YqjD/DUF883 family membrane-anchored ribosome-binding protein
MATTPFPTSTTSPPGLAPDTADKAPAGTAPQSDAQRAEDARRLSERVAQNAHALVDRTVEKLAPAVDRLKSRASEVNTAIHNSADQLGELQERWAEESRTSIRSHPLTWVAAAFAVGMVIGRMQSHR